MAQPIVRFDVRKEEAAANCNLDSILNIKDSPSVMPYGSEFKHIYQLEKLLINHPR